MNVDLPLPDELYVSPTPEIDFDKLMNLYGKGVGEEEEEMKKDRIFSHWSYVKMEFFAITVAIMEWYVNGVISIPLFKSYFKFVEKVKQFTKALEEMDESNMDKSEGEEEEYFFLGEHGDYPTQKTPLSQRGEILNQWEHFTAFLLAFEKVLRNRVSQKDLSDIWKAYMKLMDEEHCLKLNFLHLCSLPFN